MLSTEGSSIFLDHIFEDARICLENESGDCRRKNFRVKIGEWCPRVMTFCAVLGNLFKIQILVSSCFYDCLTLYLIYWMLPEISGYSPEYGKNYIIRKILRNRPWICHTVPFKLPDRFDLTLFVLALSSLGKFYSNKYFWSFQILWWWMLKAPRK